MERSYQSLKNEVESKGFKFFLGELSLNFIWERTNSVKFTNLFDDYLHIAYVDGGIEKVLTVPCTTKPGTNKSALAPENPLGIAIIQPGQYRGAWEFHDTTKEFSKYPYFRQIAALNYWRDNTKDTKIDQSTCELVKILGTHWHIMSRLNTDGTGYVNNFSEGCMGSYFSAWNKVIEVTRRSVKLYSTKFTGTLLMTEDFTS